ncbi:uncharacterized protein LOC100897826 [Galendromus occidentalis]|uniref:Uncharacterized protein LOC100897826 n=1 Tax=Galendromus occidentalis TaxID=34638 RepID=A0AAJ6QPV8_9ACAR|nr:uncharacterized protein LOC100897826 [Galendromus occidentalis]
MEISAYPLPYVPCDFLETSYELDSFAEPEEENTQRVIYFFTPRHHDAVKPAIKDVVKGPDATKAGFICSSEVVYSNVNRDPIIDVTGDMAAYIRFYDHPRMQVYPLGSPEALSVNPDDVKCVFLFGSRQWNGELRGRCADLSLGVRVHEKFFNNLLDDNELVLSRLRNVPVIGGEPTRPSLSVSPRGFIVTGGRFEVSSVHVEDERSAGQKFHQLKEAVDACARRMYRPKSFGFVFGAFGSFMRHESHYMSTDMWRKLQNEFPFTQFIGCATECVYTDVHTKLEKVTLVSIVTIDD